MAVRVYNTLSRQKEALKTVRPGNVSMYVCGATVYKPSHFGHMVGPVIFDTVKRYLTYCGFDVTMVINVTDVDDKPRATQHIGDIITIIQGLIDKGFAYPAGGDVYFDVTRDEDYG